jgi:hypothetical protein
MTLQPALLADLERQIAAGLAPEQVRSMVRDVLDNWGNEAKLDDVLSYLYERLRTDPALSEVLRGLLARSLADADDLFEMPLEMDADIRQRLFRTAEKKAVDPAPTSHSRQLLQAGLTSSRLPVFDGAAANQGRDHPHFESYSVDPDWATVGPVLSRLVWLAREQELVWTTHPHDPDARRRAILWRAVARAAHLDVTALTELQDYQKALLLDPDVLVELENVATRMQMMSDGIRGLLDTARLKEPHAG